MFKRRLLCLREGYLYHSHLSVPSKSEKELMPCPGLRLGLVFPLTLKYIERNATCIPYNKGEKALELHAKKKIARKK